MQPDGPYRYTHLLGGSPVGKAWAAVDGQGRFVTVAVLDATVAATAGWREAFAAITNNLAQTGGMPFVYADFSAAAPWVAYPAEAGPGAERLFRALGVEYQPVPATPPNLSGLPQPVSGAPQSVSSPPDPVSGAPQPTSGSPQPVSGSPQPGLDRPQPILGAFGPVSGTSQPVSGAPGPVSGAPASPGFGTPFDDTPQHDPFTAPVRRIQPSAPPKRQTGLWAAIAALLLVAAIGGGAGVWAISASGPEAPPVPAPTASPLAPGLKPWAVAPPRSDEERALATAAPSIVFLEAIVTGYVRGKQRNELLHPDPFTFSRRCTGVVVNHDGHVVTNAQCVQPTPDILVEHALGELAKVQVANGDVKTADVDNYVRTRMATTVFTGSEPGTEPEASLYGQLNVATGDLTSGAAISGSVVRALTLEEGNLALVKLDQGNLPAVEVNASATIAAGTALHALGYATADTDYRSATYSVESKQVQVTEVDLESSTYRISDDVGVSSRGGIVVDPQGQVVGILDNDVLQPDRPNRLVVPVSRVNGLLSAAGVGNTLGGPDQLYREGLDAYFDGEDSRAAARFAEVAAESPTNALAEAYREAAVAAGGDEPSRPGWAVPLLIAAGVALIGGVAALVWLRLRQNTR
ncbi:trypsin-like peptidase domain-containing protein [Verrucosispora sp. WMMD1129]|uniref:trypsin-like peptidase domain-containing protein n=1 Tax=Verrucosispora sp. WMMD1129 TaxID=3016093 RepID=UPI00249C5381|nr:trypsin-like peptidase domain-containing protein [Verrucosispora sp. WMMD1129]WFE44683.1 trypsin-like peptidase domain-containing protein [Verrucosispora sp. WMMD1129]